MKKRFMIIIFLVILLAGCQNQDSANMTWGNKYSISIEDISGINIQISDGSDLALSQEEIIRYINAISSGVFDKGQLDIRPADYTAELILKSGEKKELSLWISDGSNLFTDHEDTGHYILDENAKVTMIEILNEDRRR